MSDPKEKVAEVVKDKTWPDVASEAINGIKSGLGDIVELVQEVATKLTKSAPHIWKGIVEYNRWVSIGELITSLMFFVIAILLIVFGKKLYTKAYSEASPDKWGHWPTFLSWQMAIGIAMMFLGSYTIWNIVLDLPEEIGNVVVPERKAAIEIITVIKNGGELKGQNSSCECGK